MPIFDNNMGDNSKKALKDYIARVERIEGQKKALSDDIKEIFNIAKNEGFDTKIMRTVIKRRKLEKQERDELDDMVKIYEENINDLDGLL